MNCGSCLEAASNRPKIRELPRCVKYKKRPVQRAASVAVLESSRYLAFNRFSVIVVSLLSSRQLHGMRMTGTLQVLQESRGMATDAAEVSWGLKRMSLDSAGMQRKWRNKDVTAGLRLSSWVGISHQS